VIACTSAISAALMMRGMLRYDSAGGRSPMQIAWSASFRYAASLSAVE
jgi:hypothetical protein